VAVIDDYAWVLGDHPLDDIYCVSFIKGVPPDEVLRRFGTNAETMAEMTFDELSELSLSDHDGLPAGAGAVKVGDWTMLVEPGGFSAAVDQQTITRLSRNTELVAVCYHEFASDSFAYAVDGEMVVWFDPVQPDARSGADPDRLVGEMRAAGLDPDHDFDRDPDIDNWIGRSFILAASITGVPFTLDLLALPFLGAEMPEG